MEERETPPQAGSWTSLDWKLVGILILVTAGIRLWQLTHTEVAARDSIGFIRHAWKYHQANFADWPTVLRDSEQHPLYPLCILGTSQLLEHFHTGSTAALFQISAQLVSALAAVLLVLPVFSLGRELFDRRVGFFSALLLQCLPVSGCILADGLSEALFLLLAATALFYSVRALNHPGRLYCFALAGLFSGLAYLTRPEGALVAAATGFVLVVGQHVPSWRRSWCEVILGGAALSIAALLLALPFIAATGKLTVKPSIKRIGDDLAATPSEGNSEILLALWWHNRAEEVPSSLRFWWGFWALGSQLVKGSFYFGWLAALFGLWHYRTQTRHSPSSLMLLLVALGVAYGTWRVAAVVGYLSDRHILLIVLCALPWAAAGLIAAGDWLAYRWATCSKAPILLPLACALVGLPKVLEPLHQYRAGFKEVGDWLAENTHPIDKINDPLCWAHYYAGRVFLEHSSHPIPAGYRAHEYIVLESGDNKHPRVPVYAEAQNRAKLGTPVHTWTGKRGRKEVEVKVVAVPLYRGKKAKR